MATIREINGASVADEYGVNGSIASSSTWNSASIPSRNAGGPLRRLVGHVYSSAAGSLQYQVSFDNVTWRSLGSATAVSATTVTSFDQPVYASFSKFVFTPTGGAAAATFVISLSPRTV